MIEKGPGDEHGLCDRRLPVIRRLTERNQRLKIAARPGECSRPLASEVAQWMHAGYAAETYKPGRRAGASHAFGMSEIPYRQQHHLSQGMIIW